MWPSQWLSIENESPELLARCRGWGGQAWSYSTTHSQMLVRFYRNGSLTAIYLHCKNCDLIQFQSSWLDANVRVEISEGQSAPVYTITDGDRLRIVCGAAFLATSPELIRLEEPSVPAPAYSQLLIECAQDATGAPREPRCSFCGKRPSQVANRLIAGALGYICIGCIDICYNVRQRWPDQK